MKSVLEERQLPTATSMRLFCDNQATIKIANNPICHDGTKQVEIDRHLIIKKIEQGVVEVHST